MLLAASHSASILENSLTGYRGFLLYVMLKMLDCSLRRATGTFIRSPASISNDARSHNTRFDDENIIIFPLGFCAAAVSPIDGISGGASRRRECKPLTIPAAASDGESPHATHE